jgi:hypothetical protein
MDLRCFFADAADEATSQCGDDVEDGTLENFSEDDREEDEKLSEFIVSGSGEENISELQAFHVRSQLENKSSLAGVIDGDGSLVQSTEEDVELAEAIVKFMVAWSGRERRKCKNCRDCLRRVLTDESYSSTFDVESFWHRFESAAEELVSNALESDSESLEWLECLEFEDDVGDNEMVVDDSQCFLSTFYQFLDWTGKLESFQESLEKTPYISIGWMKYWVEHVHGKLDSQSWAKFLKGDFRKLHGETTCKVREYYNRRTSELLERERKQWKERTRKSRKRRRDGERKRLERSNREVRDVSEVEGCNCKEGSSGNKFQTFFNNGQNFEDFDPSCMEGAENADVGPVPSSVAKVLVERYSMTSVCCNDGEKLESMFLDEREQMTRAKNFKEKVSNHEDISCCGICGSLSEFIGSVRIEELFDDVELPRDQLVRFEEFDDEVKKLFHIVKWINAETGKVRHGCFVIEGLCEYEKLSVGSNESTEKKHCSAYFANANDNICRVPPKWRVQRCLRCQKQKSGRSKSYKLSMLSGEIGRDPVRYLGLPKLNEAEALCISKMVAFSKIIKLRPHYAERVQVESQSGLSKHCFTTETDVYEKVRDLAEKKVGLESHVIAMEDESKDKNETDTLPRTNMESFFKVLFHGKDEVWARCRKMPIITVDMKRVYAWLVLLAKMNPHYRESNEWSKDHWIVGLKELVDTEEKAVTEVKVGKIVFVKNKENGNTNKCVIVSKFGEKVIVMSKDMVEGDQIKVDNSILGLKQRTHVNESEVVAFNDMKVGATYGDNLGDSSGLPLLARQSCAFKMPTPKQCEAQVVNKFIDIVGEKETLRSNSVNVPDEMHELTMKADVDAVVDDAKVNEFQRNHEIFSQAFPHLFPLGVDSSVINGTLSLPLREKLLTFHDGRFAKCVNFVMFMGNQLMRHNVLRSVALSVNQSSKAVEEFQKKINNGKLRERIKAALEDEKEKKKLATEILKALKPVTAKVPWSPLEKSRAGGELISCLQNTGPSGIFVTFSPDAKNSSLVMRYGLGMTGVPFTNDDDEYFLNVDPIDKTYDERRRARNERLCKREWREDKWDTYFRNKSGYDIFAGSSLESVKKRTRVMVASPVAACKMYHRIVEAFCTELVAIDLSHKTRKSMKRLKRFRKGLFGKARSLYGVSECQKTGLLHFHCVISSTLCPTLITKHAHKPSFRKRMCKIINKIFKAEVSEEMQSIMPEDEESEAIPEWTETVEKCENEGNKLSDVVLDCKHRHKICEKLVIGKNLHKHTFACRRFGMCFCRLARPSVEEIVTRFFELEYGNLTPVDKKELGNEFDLVIVRFVKENGSFKDAKKNLIEELHKLGAFIPELYTFDTDRLEQRLLYILSKLPFSWESTLNDREGEAFERNLFEQYVQEYNTKETKVIDVFASQRKFKSKKQSSATASPVASSAAEVSSSAAPRVKVATTSKRSSHSRVEETSADVGSEATCTAANKSCKCSRPVEVTKKDCVVLDRNATIDKETCGSECDSESEDGPNEKLTWKRKEITRPRYRKISPEFPFRPFDRRMIKLGLKRSAKCASIVEYSPILTSCLRCNTCVSPSLSLAGAVQKDYYLKKYLSKNDMKREHFVSAIHSAEQSCAQSSSTADDAGTKSRDTKFLMSKVINYLHTAIEIADVQYVSLLLNYPCIYKSHNFNLIYTHDAVDFRSKMTKASKNGGSNDPLSLIFGDDDKMEFETNDDGSVEVSSRGSRLSLFSRDVEGAKKIFFLPQWYLYMFRGEFLRHLCFMEYCQCVRTEKVKKEKKKTVGGRHRNARFEFDKRSVLHGAYTQRLVSKIGFAQHGGKGPPQYPGDCEVELDEVSMESLKFRREAFSKYYSTMLIPWDVDTVQFESDVWEGFAKRIAQWGGADCGAVCDLDKPLKGICRQRYQYICNNICTRENTVRKRELHTHYRFSNAKRFDNDGFGANMSHSKYRRLQQETKEFEALIKLVSHESFDSKKQTKYKQSVHAAMTAVNGTTWEKKSKVSSDVPPFNEWSQFNVEWARDAEEKSNEHKDALKELGQFKCCASCPLVGPVFACKNMIPKHKICHRVSERSKACHRANEKTQKSRLVKPEELRNILKKLGKDTKGKKPALYDRLRTLFEKHHGTKPRKRKAERFSSKKTSSNLEDRINNLSEEQRSFFKKIVQDNGNGQYEIKSCKENLHLLHALPGCGKTHVVDVIMDAVGRHKCKFTAAVGSAAAINYGCTVHNANSWGLEFVAPNETNSKKLRNTYHKELRLIIVDEVSTLQLSNLERLNETLKHIYGDDQTKEFGGLCIILSGDFRQLPPCRDTSGYQELVKLAFDTIPLLNNSHQRAYHRKGIHTLKKFVLSELTENMRSKLDRTHCDIIKKFGNLNYRHQEVRKADLDTIDTMDEVECGVIVTRTDERPKRKYLVTSHVADDRYTIQLHESEIHEEYTKTLEEVRKYLVDRPLSSKDFQNDDWSFPTFLVRTHRERSVIEECQVRKYAAMKNEPILVWDKKIKFENDIKFTVTGSEKLSEVPHLKHYFSQRFVRGAPVMLTRNIAPSQGLANGTMGRLHSLTWDDENAVDFSQLKAGEENCVPQPRYVNVIVKVKRTDVNGNSVIEDRVYPLPLSDAKVEIPLPGTWVTYTDRDGKRTGKRGTKNYSTTSHSFDLGFTLTYHKAQGHTLDKVVLVLGDAPNHIATVEYEALYVGLSRVRSGDDIRYLKFNERDKLYHLRRNRTMKRPRELVFWRNGYDENGHWQPKLLQHVQATRRKEAYRKLAQLKCCDRCRAPGKLFCGINKRNDHKFCTSPGQGTLSPILRKELEVIAKDLGIRVNKKAKDDLYMDLIPFFDSVHGVTSTAEFSNMETRLNEALIKSDRKHNIGKRKKRTIQKSLENPKTTKIARRQLIDSVSTKPNNSWNMKLLKGVMNNGRKLSPVISVLCMLATSSNCRKTIETQMANVSSSLPQPLISELSKVMTKISKGGDQRSPVDASMFVSTMNSCLRQFAHKDCLCPVDLLSKLFELGLFTIGNIAHVLLAKFTTSMEKTLSSCTKQQTTVIIDVGTHECTEIPAKICISGSEFTLVSAVKASHATSRLHYFTVAKIGTQICAVHDDKVFKVKNFFDPRSKKTAGNVKLLLYERTECKSIQDSNTTAATRPGTTVQENKRSRIKKRKRTTIKANYVGLRNQGATCYMNAIIQQLFMLPRFRSGLLAANIPAGLGLEPVRKLKETFIHLNEGTMSYYDPVCLVIACREMNMNYDVYSQNDASEFFDKIIDLMKDMFRNTSSHDFLRSHFGGTTATLCERNCGYNSCKIDPLTVLPLAIIGKTSIGAALDKWMKSESMNGLECDCDDPVHMLEKHSVGPGGRLGAKINVDGKIKIKVDGLRRACFDKLPNLLVLSLKRFEFNNNTQSMYKLSSRCAFPEKLNMQKYTQQYLDTLDKRKLAANNFEYALKGIVVHVGTTETGHYYSIIKDTRNQWFKFDDQTVLPFSKSKNYENFFGEFFGNGNEEDHTAFMLLYERVQPRKRKQEANSAGATKKSNAEDVDAGRSTQKKKRPRITNQTVSHRTKKSTGTKRKKSPTQTRTKKKKKLKSSGKSKRKSHCSPRKTLTRGERERVRKALYAEGDSNEVLVQRFRIPVKRSDLQRLKIKKDRVTKSLWLTDEIINCWMNMLQAETDARAACGVPAGLDGKPFPSCHFFSSFFFSKLMFDMDNGYCYTNVRRWTLKLHHEKDIFGRDCIVVPIHFPTHNGAQDHWAWACIFPKRKRIEYYDSFNRSGQQYCKALLRFLVDDANDKHDHPDRKGSPVHDFDSKDWVFANVDMPQQGNGHDCGVFTCVGALHLSRNMPMDSFSQDDMPFFRKSIALSLLDGKIVPELPEAFSE